MRKVKYLYIPIGGIGSRLKKEKSHLLYSSKCFLFFYGKTLLERIIENCKDFCQEIIIYYCLDEQYYDAFNLLGDSIFNMKVHYKKSFGSDPYLGMEDDGDCLAFMGDTYIEKEYLNVFMNHVISYPMLTFLRLDPIIINQQYTYYHYNGEYIDALSYSEKNGYEHFEIGQLIYFPQEIVSRAVDLCFESNPLLMLHTYIIENNKTCCLKLPCFNINDGKDYDLVSNIIAKRRT